MRYDDAHRLTESGGVWLRFKLRILGSPWFRPVILPDLGNLSDHQLRDIGAPERTRYMDWNELQNARRY